MATLNHWTLAAFARENGKLKLTNEKEYTNSHNGQAFTSRMLAFEHPTKMNPEKPELKLCKFVYFAKTIGQLSPKEITARQASLQIVENPDKAGTYYLCNVGDAWEDVELDLTMD